MEFMIKEARIAANMTQQQLAEKLGIKDATLSGYENGKHDPKSETLMQIADICGTSVDYLLGRTNNEKTIVDSKNDDHSDQDNSKIISAFAALNPAGQGLVMDYLHMIASKPEYRKDGQSKSAI